MSVLSRKRNGMGCEPLEPDDRVASIPATVRDKAGRPADLDLYTRCLSDEWEIGPDVKADVVARLHAVVKYINDPRAVVRASQALINASGVSVRAKDTAMKVLAMHPATHAGFATRKIDLQALDRIEAEPEHDPESEALTAATRAWDAAHAEGRPEHDCDLASVGAWAAVWEAAGLAVPSPSWITPESLPDARDP